MASPWFEQARLVKAAALSAEALFTAVERGPRDKAKNVIDTVVSRAGDALGGWLHAAAGLGTAGVALAAIPGALALAGLGLRLGKRYRQRIEAGRPPGLGSAAAPSAPR